MAENTNIEWADHTFNPWIGCTKVSPACDHCYAERTAKRMQVTWGAGSPRKRTSPSNWAQPLRWNRQAAERGIRYRVFCASLADVFDNEVPTQWRADLFALIRETPHLDWLLLTKRIGNVSIQLEKARIYADRELDLHTAFWVRDWLDNEPPPNVWLGATVVNQAEADRDVPKLLDTPAAVRFLSIEPMLERIDLCYLQDGDDFHNALSGSSSIYDPDYDGQPAEYAYFGVAGGARLDWVIAGGESGPHARPSHPTWFRALRDQCVESGVAFLFKQWGEWVSVSEVAGPGPIYEFPDHACVRRVGKKNAGRTLDHLTWDEVPA